MDQLPELKKRREEVKKDIDDLSFEKEKNKNKIDELFKVLKELDSQIAGLEEKFEKQKKCVSLSTVVFRSLQSVLNRSHEFYPNNELFDEDLVYFPGKEHQAMRDMQECLTAGTEERMFLLYGDPASGKTVMGIAVGKALEKDGYECLYHKLTDESDIDDLWSEILPNGEKDVLFIIDDCHLNIETVNRLYTRYENIPHAACLLISRFLPKNIRTTDEYLPDIFEKLKDRSYKMDVEQDKQVEDKMSGIISKRKAFYQRTKNKEFIVGDVQRVLKNVRRNYLTLYFYLSFWTDTQSLDQLDESKVLQKVYSRYLDIKANKPHRDVFLKYAALYQYEIQFRPIPGDEDSIEALSGHGILEYNPDTELYRFYHSDFAKLLLKSYSIRSVFKEKYTTLEEFTTVQLKTYINGFRTYPPNLAELYNNLVVNAGIPVFRTLLKDAEVKDKTTALYQIIEPLYLLPRFLFWVKDHANDEFDSFLEELIINNPSIKNLFLNGKETFFPFCRILKMLKNSNPGYYYTFLEMFNTDERELILLNTPLHRVGNSLSTLGKSDMSTAKFLLNDVTVNELLKKAYQLEFHKLGKALSDLKNVNPEKTKEILDAINIDLLLPKAQEVSFERLGNSLNELNNINPEKAKEIFDAINIYHLAAKAQEVSFERLGHALIELKNVNPEKAKEIFDEINIDHLAAKAQEVSFDRLGHALSNLKNVNPGKAKEIFDKIEPGFLLDKAQEVDFKRFASALYELKKIDIEKCGEILRNIDPHTLIHKIQQEEYHIFLQLIPAVARIDAAATKQLLTGLPEVYLFQYEMLLVPSNLNSLFSAFHLSGHKEYAMKLVDFAKENLDTFMENPLNDTVKFLSLCSEYIDVKPIISKYGDIFFGMMKYGEPSRIAFFLKVIHGIDRITASEYLHYLEKIGLNETLGNCYYQIGKSLAENEEIAGSIKYLKKALPLFEEFENKNCLVLTYFLLAKNEEALNHREEARSNANKALLNAGELRGLEKEIEDFIIQINQ